jgi:hypothetical protein
MALEQVYFQELQLLIVCIILSMLHTHSSVIGRDAEKVFGPG